jgi:hypothetical protein
MDDHSKSKMTIDLPIYHTKKFTRKKLKNMPSRSFQDFEIII